MKQVILLFAMLMVGISTGAQEWKKTVLEADELKGQEATEVYIYDDPTMGSMVLWNWDEYQFRLISAKGQFNIETGWTQYTGSYAGVNIFVGLYDADGNLKEKFKMWLDLEENTANRFIRTRDRGSMFNPVGQKKKVRKIFSHLKSTKGGYVRIVAERFERADFDLKIPTYTEQ